MDVLGQETSHRLARFGRYRHKRYARMGSFLFMELVKSNWWLQRLENSPHR
jgi:hypothetical protein